MQQAPTAQAARSRVTWEDFIALDEGDPRELIGAQLVETEVPGKRHERIVALVLRRVGNWAEERRAGEVYGSGYKIRITKTKGVMPDVQFYRSDNETDRREEGCISGGPDLAVEVISPNRRRIDRVTK